MTIQPVNRANRVFMGFYLFVHTHEHTHKLLIVLCQMDALQRSIKNNNGIRIARSIHANKDNNGRHQSIGILVVVEYGLKCEMEMVFCD